MAEKASRLHHKMRRTPFAHQAVFHLEKFPVGSTSVDLMETLVAAVANEKPLLWSGKVVFARDRPGRQTGQPRLRLRCVWHMAVPLDL